jgi:hypothetical protein
MPSRYAEYRTLHTELAMNIVIAKRPLPGTHLKRPLPETHPKRPLPGTHHVTISGLLLLDNRPNMPECIRGNNNNATVTDRSAHIQIVNFQTLRPL